MAFPKKSTIGLVVVLAILYQVYLKSLLFTTLGLGRHMQSIHEFPYRCRRIEDPRLQACEDMWLSERSRQLFLACSDPVARAQWMPNVGRLNASGRALDDAIIALDIDEPKGDSFEYRVLKTSGFGGVSGDGRLHLVGMTGRDTSDGVELFLVNAQPSVDSITGLLVDNTKTGANSTIESFTLSGKATELVHKKTFSNPEIRTPNNVALVSNGFYITNDHGTAKAGLGFTAAMYVGNGDVTYCSSENECKKVAKGFHFPNGLVTGRDGHLYVPSAFTGDLDVYSINPTTSELEKIDHIGVECPIDNMSVDKEGVIFAAGLCQLPKVLEGFADPLGKIAPATIFKLRNSTADGWTIEKVLEDRDAEILPGATVAVHDAKSGRVFVGGITSPFIAVCEPRL